MADRIKARNGSYLGQLLEPIGSTTPRAACGWKEGGVGIHLKYAATEVVGDRLTADTGIKFQGTDIRAFFRKKATAAPVITSSSGSGQYSVGQTVTLSVVTQGATRWEWYKGGDLIAGQTGRSYSFTYDGNPSYYTCIAANSYSGQGAYFSVLTYVPPVAPQLNGITGGGSVDWGNMIQLHVIVTAGTEPLTFEWTGPNGPLAGNSEQIGFTATSSATGTYSCKVSNSAGDATASTSVTVIPPKPYCEIDWEPTDVYAGVNNGEVWHFSAEAAQGTTLAWVRFQILGHPSTVSPTPYTGQRYESSISWGPMGNPDIFNTPGTYTLRIDCADANGKTDDDSVTITVH